MNEPSEIDYWLADTIGAPILRWLDKYIAPHIERLTVWINSIK